MPNMSLLQDPAKVAGLITLAALATLILLNKGFAGVRVKLGD